MISAGWPASARQVLRVLVVSAQAHVDPDVVQQRGGLQQQALAIAEAMFAVELVEQAGREHRHVAAVRPVELEAMTQRFGARQHLAFEVVGAEASFRLQHLEQDAAAQRGVRDEDAARGGFGEQRAIDEERRHQRFGFDSRQSEAVHEALIVEPLDLVAEGHEGLPRDRPNALRLAVLLNMRGREADVAADGDHLRHAMHRDLEQDFVDDGRDRALQQRDLNVHPVPAQIEPLPKAHGAERVHAGAVRFAAAHEREAGTAAADLRQERPGALQRRMPAKRLPDGEVHQATLFGLVDRVEDDARASAYAVEEHLAVARFAHGARRDRAHARDAVRLHDAPEAVERDEGRVGRARADDAVREGVAAEQHAARRFFHDANRLARRDFGDDEPNRARTHVENRDELAFGRSCRWHEPRLR